MREAFISIHAGKPPSSSYDIVTPRNWRDPEYDESDEDEEDDADTFVKKTNFLVYRRACDLCCRGKHDDKSLDMENLPAIEMLSWRETRQIPDGCPLCHKVLFKTDQSLWG